MKSPKDYRDVKIYPAKSGVRYIHEGTTRFADTPSEAKRCVDDLIDEAGQVFLHVGHKVDARYLLQDSTLR